MSAITVIRQGEDLEFVFDLNGESIEGWIATIEVKRFPSDTPLIQREIPAVGRTWPGFLTSTETAALDVSSESPYYLIGILTNSSTNEERQIPRRFNVNPDLLLPEPPENILLITGTTDGILITGTSDKILITQN